MSSIVRKFDNPSRSDSVIPFLMLVFDSFPQYILDHLEQMPKVCVPCSTGTAQKSLLCFHSHYLMNPYI